MPPKTAYSRVVSETRAAISAEQRRILALEFAVKTLRAQNSELTNQLQHRLCYKCAAHTQARATKYRITEARQGRLFLVEECVDGAWRTLTRRTMRHEAEAALKESEERRHNRVERALRLDRSQGASKHGAKTA